MESGVWVSRRFLKHMGLHRSRMKLVQYFIWRNRNCFPGSSQWPFWVFYSWPFQGFFVTSIWVIKWSLGRSWLFLFFCLAFETKICVFPDENYQLWRLWLFICLLCSRKKLYSWKQAPPQNKNKQHGNQVCPKQNHSWTTSDWFCSWAEVIKCDSSDFCQACLENAACNM